MRLLLLWFVLPLLVNAQGGEKSPIFYQTRVFDAGRFPNIVVTTQGTVVVSWGNEELLVKRSEDGGQTWSAPIKVASPGFQGGGLTVDETTGDLLVFSEEGHPVSPLTIFRSQDDGQTWQKQPHTILPNSQGHIPSMHMNERGMTLSHEPYRGRLIRPTRYYGAGNDRPHWSTHYTNAMYSDDGGTTWQASEPFPVRGTGEAAIVELADGTLYYNSRRHLSTDGRTAKRRYIAYSKDGGHTWEESRIDSFLPDGAQHTDYGLMAGLDIEYSEDGSSLMLFSNIDVPVETKEADVPFEQRTSRRYRGTVWGSKDEGRTWPIKKLVETGSFAYSSLCFGRKGTPTEDLIFLFYEHDGGGEVMVFNRAWLLQD